MMSLGLAILTGIVLLLFCIIRLKLPAFVSLLLASIITGILSGLDSQAIIDTVQNGMAGTLGFVATVVGLGALFGGILEHTGSAKHIAQSLLKITGEKKAPLAMMLTGFLVSIPVFFDVGFILLFPILHALHKRTGKSILHYAIPLLAGLAVTHACIPPTPGPIAVAEIINASLGWVILLGVIIGLPMAILGGLFYGKYIGNKIDVQLDTMLEVEAGDTKVPSLAFILGITLLPIFLIVFASLLNEEVFTINNTALENFILLIGHPFSALLIAILLAWYLLGIRNGMSSEILSKISGQSLKPAGIIILVTGAGGVYKQTLIDTGAGEAIAMQMQSMGLSVVVFAFLAAAIIRILQGSATVAMITGAGLVAPLLSSYDLSPIQLAAIVIATSSGATMMSHLNDSGFWLVKEYLQLTEKQGFKTWTVASSIIGLVGGVLSVLVFHLG